MQTCTTPLPKQCQTTRQVTGPDNASYRIDSYIKYTTPTSGRQLKQVTVVVRDYNNQTHGWARETSTFDPAVSG